MEQVAISEDPDESLRQGWEGHTNLPDRPSSLPLPPTPARTHCAPVTLDFGQFQDSQSDFPQ